LLLPDPAYTILSPSNAVVTILDAGTNLAPVVNIRARPPAPFFSSAQRQYDPRSHGEGRWRHQFAHLLVEQGQRTRIAGIRRHQPGQHYRQLTNSGIYVLRLTPTMATSKALPSHAWWAPSSCSLPICCTGHSMKAAGRTCSIPPGGNNGVLAGSPTWVTNGVLEAR